MDRFDMIKRFSGGVGHDINNLLTGIMGFVMLMQEDIDKDSECRGYAEGIRRSALKLQELTRKLLAVNNKKKYKRTEIHPRTLLDAAIRDTRDALEDMEVKPDSHFEDHVRVFVDTEKVILALCCILAYLKYRTSGCITVRSGGAEPAGRAPEDVRGGVNYLFSASRRADLEASREDTFEPLYTTSSHFLLGCELALAREIFTDHGGGLTSEGTDPGTLSFNAFLPSR
jgi:light-regulated signal transduction histidine kinase (bacteriophytochrome)